MARPSSYAIPPGTVPGGMAVSARRSNGDGDGRAVARGVAGAQAEGADASGCIAKRQATPARVHDRHSQSPWAVDARRILHVRTDQGALGQLYPDQEMRPCLLNPGLRKARWGVVRFHPRAG